MVKERTTKEIIDAFWRLDVSEQVDLYNEYANKVGSPYIKRLIRANFEASFGSSYDFLDEILSCNDYDTETYTCDCGFSMTPYFAMTGKATLTLINKEYVGNFIFDHVANDVLFAKFVYDRYGNALDFDDDCKIDKGSN